MIFQGFLVLLLVGGGLACNGGGGGDVREEGADGWREVEEDVRLEGIRFREWKKGRLTWVLEAREVAYRHREEKASFHEVSVVFHPLEGGRPLALRADRVLYDIGPRTLQAEGGVFGQGEQGFRFRTESLAYDMDEKRVRTDDRVTLEKDRLVVEGTGMEGSLADQTFLLLSSVHTLFLPPDGVVR